MIGRGYVTFLDDLAHLEIVVYVQQGIDRMAERHSITDTPPDVLTFVKIAEDMNKSGPALRTSQVIGEESAPSINDLPEEVTVSQIAPSSRGVSTGFAARSDAARSRSSRGSHTCSTETWCWRTSPARSPRSRHAMPDLNPAHHQDPAWALMTPQQISDLAASLDDTTATDIYTARYEAHFLKKGLPAADAKTRAKWWAK